MPEEVLELIEESGATAELVDEGLTLGAPVSVASAESDPLYSVTLEPGTEHVLPNFQVEKRDGSTVAIEFKDEADGPAYVEDYISPTRITVNGSNLQDVEPGTDSLEIELLTSGGTAAGVIETPTRIRVPNVRVNPRSGPAVSLEYRDEANGAIYTEAAVAASKVQVNGADRFTGIGEGATTNVPGVDSNDSATGTWSTGKQRIADSPITFNGAAMTDIRAQATGAFTILDHLGNQGGAKVNATTWQMAAPDQCIPCTVTPSTTTPGLFALVTLTCDQAGLNTYNWRITANDSTLKIQNSFSFSGQSIQFRPIYDGTWTVELTVTNGSGGVGRSTLTLTVTNGVRYCLMTQFTPPVGGGLAPYQNEADLSPVKAPNALGNHVNSYHANKLTASTQGGILWLSQECIAYSRWGFSPTYDTYTGSAVQSLDPAWKWQVGGYSANQFLGRSDNGSIAAFSSPTRTTNQLYWFRLEREAGGTVKLYVLNEVHSSALERYISNQLDWTLLHTYSQTSTADLYIRGYIQSIQGGVRLFKYGQTT